jgi:hypothetical protein
VAKSNVLIPALLAAAAGALGAAEFPEAGISNGSIRAKLYLPDPQRGYYQGTRFEWSGIIHSLQFKDHEYFGVWFERYDPKIHDAITGPVESTREGDLLYNEAKPGETFVRLGVGVVRRPDDRPFHAFHTYEIVDPGEWKVRTSKDRVEFTHDLKHESGLAYVYRKTVRLAKNKPELLIEHSLRNTGRRVIETAQYNHNFFVIDKQPTGPEFTVKFPFDARATLDLKDKARVENGELVYLRELEKGESVFTELKGFGGTAKDYDFRIENRKVGAGVRITGDRPLTRLVYWSIRTTLCPEPYIDIRVEPGRETKWNIAYEFYTLTPRARSLSEIDSTSQN